MSASRGTRCTLPVQLCFDPKIGYSLSLSPSRCILRYCVIARTPTLGLRKIWTPAGQAAPPPITRHTRAMFRRCLPGCAPASGLLLSAHTSRRACSVRQHDYFFPPNRCYAQHRGRGDGLLTLPITQAHQFPARPAESARERFAQSQGFRLSEVLCRCVAPVQLLFLLHSAAARVLAACHGQAADLAVADSPPSTRRRPSGRNRATRGNSG